ncbi:MAG: diguanylate cyclase [Leptospiraceae bacterium]|nr:diguanylate cyclase [Leptospiraceae bacterium]MCP5511487.1 diguanylate cyclase [Leptospiraceae bacterium]
MSSNKEKYEKLDISILFVEDDIIIQKTTTHILENMVSEIRIAGDGKQGIELYLARKPDLVITDIEMPEMNGIQMAKAILEMDPEKPIVIMTSHVESEFLIDAINLGIKGFLPKPVIHKTLYHLLQKFYSEIQMKNEFIKNQSRVNKIMNFQQTMVILTDGINVLDINGTVLEFFDFQSKQAFLEACPTILDLIPVFDQFLDEGTENWVQSFLRSGAIQNNRVRFINPKSKEFRTFLIRYNRVPEENIYIFNLTDVTEIEQKTISLEKKAFTDDLTKIYNRSKFQEVFDAELTKIHEIPDLAFALIMFDIDHFKSVNDTYGHNVGDTVLVDLVEEVKKTIRRTDSFFRWGGEEFLLILPSTDSNGAAILAEKIRSRVEARKFSIDRKVTVSLGVTEVTSIDKMVTVLERADSALYEAKYSGRNRYILR